jgi:general L-amino acid transport system permease protein
MNTLLRRLRHDLFATPADGLISVVLLAVIAGGASSFLRWAISQARWAVIQANSTLFAVGRYPIDQQWRLWLLTALLAAATGISWGMLRSHPRPDRGGILWPRNDRIGVGLLVALSLALPLMLGLSPAVQLRWVAMVAVLVLLRWLAGRFGPQLPAPLKRLLPLGLPLLYLVGMVLIAGGLGLVSVSPSEWGGLLLTLLQSSFAILLCFPLGLLLALGRRSELPMLRWGSVLYIEFIRGAPLITLLFLGQNMLGFLLPGDSILFAAGLLAGSPHSDVEVLPLGLLWEPALPLPASTLKAPVTTL